MKRIWKKSAVIASQIKDLLTSFPAENSRMKKKWFAALAVMVLAAGFAVCQEKKVFNDTEGMIEKFLQRGKYVKAYDTIYGVVCDVYILAERIKSFGVGEADNVVGVFIYTDGEDLEFDLSESSISLDSECNIIITPKK